jgi:hypothetical protein
MMNNKQCSFLLYSVCYEFICHPFLNFDHMQVELEEQEQYC